MIIERILSGNNHINHINFHSERVGKSDVSHHYASSLQEIKNNALEYSSLAADYVNDTDPFLNESGNTIEEEEKITYLFNCVSEFTKNIECLLKTGPTKYVQIELNNKKFLVAVKNVTLPSGKKIFAGYFNNSLVVSDGENYHIQYGYHKPPTFFSSLSLLLSHFVQGGNWLGTRLWPDWLRSTDTWFSAMGDPLLFPQCEGLPIPPHVSPQRTVLHTAEVEFSARLEPVRPNESAGDINNSIVTPATSALSERVSPKANDSIHQPDGYGQLTFSIDGLEFRLSPANEEAKTLLQTNFEDFARANNPPLSDSLTNLLEFDKFLGEKVARIFHQGLYLKHKIPSIDIIISKAHIEDIIFTLAKLAEKKPSTLERFESHTSNNFMVNNFINNMDKQLKEASRHIDIDIIKDIVSYMKHKTFDRVRQEIIEKLSEEDLEKKLYYKNLLHVFKLFHEAFDEYRQQLNHDTSPPLARVAYINTRQIYSALINNEKKHLRDSLIKLKFYSIFDYTRSNDISIYSLNFIFPGEVTSIGDIFSIDERVYNKTDMDKLFSDEFLNFIYQKPSGHLYFEQLIDLIELSKLSYSDDLKNLRWQKKNLAPLTRTYEILSEIIESNYREKYKFTEHTAWYNDFKNIIDKDKKIYILISYLINLQKMSIHHITDYLDHNIQLTARTHEQHIVAAKIEAVRDRPRHSPEVHSDSDLLNKYIDLEKVGDVSIMIRAASFWFVSQQARLDDDFLSSSNVLYILRQFVSVQQQFILEYDDRQQQSHTSVYSLKSSLNKGSLEEYYKQFIDYKKYHSFIEARKLTRQALESATINYIDVIFPAKEIYCYKVFSRNYVTNNLSPFTSVYLPAENIGYVMIAKLHSNRTILLTTLNGFSFIVDVDSIKNEKVLTQMKHYWQSSRTDFDLRHRPHFSLNETALASLFPNIDANSATLSTMIDILLQPPEETPIGSTASAYTLSAVKSSDISLIIEPYLFNRAGTFEPMNLNLPFITHIDNLNQATLISITDNLKEKLRHYSWLEYVASFIPFFTTLCRQWYDEEHEIEFSEIIFDLYDLISSLVNMAGQFKKISENTLKHALYKAVKQKTHPHLIRAFVINEVISASPNIGLKMAKSFANEISSYYNIIHPSGKVLSIADEIIPYKVQEALTRANNAITSSNLYKKNFRQPWKSNVDKKQLKTLPTGILVQNTTMAEKYYFVNDNDYFPVFWDKYHNEWRIINSKGENSKDFAIPIARSHSGSWVASAGQIVDMGLSSLGANHIHPKNFEDAKLIQIEPSKTFDTMTLINNDLINFHKKIFRFYLERHEATHIFITGIEKHHLLVDSFFRSFSLKQTILTMKNHDGFAYDPRSWEQAQKALDDKADAKVCFRAVSAWRSAHDSIAEFYVAISITIAQQRYIIDISNVRSSFGHNDIRDVFTENEWLMMFNKLATNDILIKFKDFESLQDAKFFGYREAIAPYVFIKNGFLIREPSWYRMLLLKNNYPLTKENDISNTMCKHGIHIPASSLRLESYSLKLKEEFPLFSLLNCGILDSIRMMQLLNMVNLAKTDSSNSRAVISNEYQIETTRDLLKINKGKLLAFYNIYNCLEHLLLSMGQGRFMGLGNDLYGFTVHRRASIVLAEQMGTFNRSLLTLHNDNGGKSFHVVAGDAFGATDDTPVLADDLPSEMKPTFHADGRISGYQRQFIPREQILLGKDCHIFLLPENQESKPRLRIKHFGTLFHINHMDAIELSDIIVGLQYIDDAKFILRSIASIELYSCFSGYGHEYSTAQILADELGIEINTYPHKISDEIRQRRPEWFHRYRPAETKRLDQETNSEALVSYNQTRFIDTQIMQRDLRDIMGAVRNVIKRFSTLQGKDSATEALFSPASQQIPFIYIDILQLFYPPNVLHPRTVSDIVLTEKSLLLLDDILADYDISGDEEDVIIEQALMDIILSIDEFKYLSERFYHMSAMQ